jgi:hypothetical protein
MIVRQAEKAPTSRAAAGSRHLYIYMCRDFWQQDTLTRALTGDAFRVPRSGRSTVGRQVNWTSRRGYRYAAVTDPVLIRVCSRCAPMSSGIDDRVSTVAIAFSLTSGTLTRKRKQQSLAIPLTLRMPPQETRAFAFTSLG